MEPGSGSAALPVGYAWMRRRTFRGGRGQGRFLDGAFRKWPNYQGSPELLLDAFIYSATATFKAHLAGVLQQQRIKKQQLSYHSALTLLVLYSSCPCHTSGDSL